MNFTWRKVTLIEVTFFMPEIMVPYEIFSPKKMSIYFDLEKYSWKDYILIWIQKLEDKIIEAHNLDREEINSSLPLLRIHIVGEPYTPLFQDGGTDADDMHQGILLLEPIAIGGRK